MPNILLKESKILIAMRCIRIQETYIRKKLNNEVY